MKGLNIDLVFKTLIGQIHDEFTSAAAMEVNEDDRNSVVRDSQKEGIKLGKGHKTERKGCKC